MYLCIIQLSQQPTQGKYFYHPHFIAKKTETWEVKKFEQGHRANRSRGPPGYDTHALYNTLKQLLPRNGDSELTGNVWVLLSSKLCQARNIKWNFATDSDECPFFFLHLLIYLASLSVSCREGNGTPLQDSCLENPTDGGAWWAAVHGVTESRTGLSDLAATVLVVAWGI